MKSNYKIFSLSASKPLATEIARILGEPLGALHHEKFQDGEVFIRFDESIRSQKIYLVAQVNMPYENLFELFIAIDAAKRASASEITCIIPYLPHARQERRDKNRTSIAARVIADFLQSVGANRVLTIDLHTSSIEGLFKIPVDNLDGSGIFLDHILSRKMDDICLCSPDFGGVKRLNIYKSILNCDVAIINKERLKANSVARMEIIGSVHQKNVIVIDDIIDTAQTICKAATLLKSEGARSVIVYSTHAVLSGDAIDSIEKSPIEALFVSDSVPSTTLGKISTLSCAPLIASHIKKLISTTA